MEKVLRHGLPLATVELSAQAARLAELAAVGSLLGTTALAALAASHCAASLFTAPLAHVTSSVVAHLAVRPLGGGLTGQRRPLDGRAHAAATAALAALLTAPVTGVYCSFPALLRALPSPPEAGVVDGAESYLPLLSASALPLLLHAAALGYLRAWQRMSTAAVATLVVALLYALLLPAAVKTAGLPAAALSTAALHCASLVALVASHPNAFTAAPAAASPPLPLPLAAYDRFLDVCHGFGGAATLALLRAGSSPMLLLFALGGGCDADAVAALSLLFALLQACLAPWVAVQLSALTFAAKYLAQGRHRAAHGELKNAS